MDQVGITILAHHGEEISGFNYVWERYEKRANSL